MKKQTKRALSLRAETIAKLSADQLHNINGGWTTIVTRTLAWPSATSTLSGTGTLSGGPGDTGTGG